MRAWEQIVAMPARWLARFLHSVQRLHWRFFRPLTVGVRLLAVESGKVLLVRHTYLEGWYLPGGGVQDGESLTDAVGREAAEEAGVFLHDLRLFGVYSSFFEGKSDHIVVFVSEKYSWQSTANREIENVDCFSVNKLPEGTSPGTRRRIAEFASGANAVSAPW